MRDHFIQFARYNMWANARLYEAAFTVVEPDYRRDVGAFFKSLHGTLNHLLLTDRIWMKRLTGEGEHPDRLNEILYDARVELGLARADEDDRILDFVASLDDESLSVAVAYTTTNGRKFEQRRADILSHLFNHQTHHRGQAHTILSICTRQEPPPLDLLAMQRGLPGGDIRSFLGSGSYAAKGYGCDL